MYNFQKLSYFALSGTIYYKSHIWVILQNWCVKWFTYRILDTLDNSIKDDEAVAAIYACGDGKYEGFIATREDTYEVIPLTERLKNLLYFWRCLFIYNLVLILMRSYKTLRK